MKNSQIIIDHLIIQDIVKAASMEKSAQDIVSSITSSLKSYFDKTFRKDEPIASIASVLAPGLLYSFGFPGVGVIMQVAGFLGFDWHSFWENLGTEIQEFARNIHGQPVSQSAVYQNVNSIVQRQMQNSFSGNIDTNSLQGFLTTHQSYESELNEAWDTYANLSDKSILKIAASRGSIAARIIKFFSRFIVFGIVSLLGYAGVIGIKKLLNRNKLEPSSSQQQSSQQSSSTQLKIKVSPDAPRELFEVEPNDANSIWIENQDINNVENILLSWTIAINPILAKYSSQIEESVAFQNMVEKFKNRNKMGEGMGIFAVPQPYTRKVDIATEIANGFLLQYKDQILRKRHSNMRTI